MKLSTEAYIVITDALDHMIEISSEKDQKKIERAIEEIENIGTY